MNITDEQLGSWLAEAQGKTFGAVAQLRFVLEKALPSEPVAMVTGSDMLIGREYRGLAVEKGVSLFSFKPGTKLYAAPVQVAPSNGAGLPICNHSWLDLKNEFVGSRYVAVGRRCQLCDRITTDTES